MLQAPGSSRVPLLHTTASEVSHAMQSPTRRDPLNGDRVRGASAQETYPSVRAQSLVSIKPRTRSSFFLSSTHTHFLFKIERKVEWLGVPKRNICSIRLWTRLF